MKQAFIESLEQVNDSMDELGEIMLAALPPLGIDNAEAAKALCAVLAEYNDTRTRLRYLSALVECEG